MTIKGQVLIPKHVREAAGLVPGKPVEVVLNAAGEAVVRAAAASDAQTRRLAMRERIERARELSRNSNAFPGTTTDEFIEWVRGPAAEV